MVVKGEQKKLKKKKKIDMLVDANHPLQLCYVI